MSNITSFSQANLPTELHIGLREFFAGVKAQSPLMVTAIPLGTICGTLAAILIAWRAQKIGLTIAE